MLYSNEQKHREIILNADDRICFHTIYEAINEVVGTNYRGWQRACWPSPTGSDDVNFRIWFTKLAILNGGKYESASFGCVNVLSEDGTELVFDDLKPSVSYDEPYTGYDLIFAKEPNNGPYVFRGLFVLDMEKTKVNKRHFVSKRIATKVKLNGCPAHTIEIID